MFRDNLAPTVEEMPRFEFSRVELVQILQTNDLGKWFRENKMPEVGFLVQDKGWSVDDLCTLCLRDIDVLQLSQYGYDVPKRAIIGGVVVETIIKQPYLRNPVERTRLESLITQLRNVTSTFTNYDLDTIMQCKTPGELVDWLKQYYMKETAEYVEQFQLSLDALERIWPLGYIEKGDFKDLDEAKRLESLSLGVRDMARKYRRDEILDSARLGFRGRIIKFTKGPCSRLNFWSKREKRGCLGTRIDMCCCNPRVPYDLDDPYLEVHRNYLKIITPWWKEEYGKYDLNTMLASPNKVPFRVFVEQVDFSSIETIDYNLDPHVDEYTQSLSDDCLRCCCCSLRREPRSGKFFWISCCQRMCGYTHYYKPSRDGEIIIKHKNGKIARLDVPIYSEHEYGKLSVREIFHVNAMGKVHAPNSRNRVKKSERKSRRNKRQKNLQQVVPEEEEEEEELDLSMLTKEQIINLGEEENEKLNKTDQDNKEQDEIEEEDVVEETPTELFYSWLDYAKRATKFWLCLDTHQDTGRDAAKLAAFRSTRDQGVYAKRGRVEDIAKTLIHRLEEAKINRVRYMDTEEFTLNEKRSSPNYDNGAGLAVASTPAISFVQ